MLLLSKLHGAIGGFVALLVVFAGIAVGIALPAAPPRQSASLPSGSQMLSVKQTIKRSLEYAGFHVHEAGAVWRISLPGNDVLSLKRIPRIDPDLPYTGGIRVVDYDGPDVKRIALQRVFNTEIAYWNLYGACAGAFDQKSSRGACPKDP